MKTHFNYYYKYTENELKTIFSQAIVSCDANVLLNMYRYPQENSLLFLDILGKYSDRLWLSYQAAWEFHKDRLSVLSSLKGKCKEVESLFNKFEEELNNKVQPNNLLRIKSKLTGAIAKMKKELSKAKEICNSEYESIDNEISSDKVVLDRILTLFDGKVGEELERLEDVYKEGKKRYEQKIPPGYADLKGKKDNPDSSLYGDFVIWKELIKKSKEDNKDMIFITDDQKEDWFLQKDGKKYGARPELRAEFYKATNNHNIYVCSMDTFISQSNHFFEAKVEEQKLRSLTNIIMDYDLIKKEKVEYEKKKKDIYYQIFDKKYEEISKNGISLIEAKELLDKSHKIYFDLLNKESSDTKND